MELHEAICLKCQHHFLIPVTAVLKLDEVPGEAFRWHCPFCNQPTYAEFCRAENGNLGEEAQFLQDPADWFLEKEHSSLDG